MLKFINVSTWTMVDVEVDGCYRNDQLLKTVKPWMKNNSIYSFLFETDSGFVRDAVFESGSADFFLFVFETQKKGTFLFNF